MIDSDDALAVGPDFAERFRDQPRPACQLYLISPERIDAAFADRLAEALSSRVVAAFQLRLKGVDQHEAARLALPLQRICADHEVAFIVNDDMGLAKRLDADGVHLGQGDGSAVDARRLLGPNVQIGVTCHNSRHLAMDAGEAGADYVAFGAFFPTPTKQVEYFADPALLSWWTVVSEIPCVAIGGITAGNCAPIVAAGADFIAVSSAIWGHDAGPAEAVKALQSAMASPAALRRNSAG